ncbi:Protein CutA [Lamellibrachia satsuma]|nr:Protein CutA [Lamellibrachia satsuma]
MAGEYVPGTHSMAFVTVPNPDVAKKLASGLVQNKLAACVNIIPQIMSVYEWEGKIEEDSELLLVGQKH